MKRIFLFFSLHLIFSFVFSQQSNNTDGLKEVKGGKFIGGTLKLNEPDYFSTLFPPSAVDFISKRVISQLYEGLTGFNAEDLSLKNVLAESYKVSEDGKVYTFQIRKKVLFHDDKCFQSGKGREMNASDVKHCLTF